MMRDSHVTHLLTAYVHKQLTPRQRARVHQHLDTCLTCRAALDREQFIARDLKYYMPQVGRPEPGQLRRLWPRIRSELRAAPPSVKMLPSMSVFAMMVILCTFAVSSLFGAQTHAIAAPNPLVPADIRATNTPFHTDEPTGETVESAMVLMASQTASPFNLPQPSPAPPPMRAFPGSNIP